MSEIRTNLRRAMLGLLAVASLLCGVALAVGCDDPPRLRFSLVPQGNVEQDLVAYRPLFSSLQAALGKPVEVVTPSSYGYVVEGLLSGAIDLAVLGPAAYVAAKKGDPGITVFTTYAKKGGAFQEEGPFYRSYLVVRKAGRFPNIAALRGSTLALTDPGSTSGAVLPRHIFGKLIGSPLDQYFGHIVYVGDHDHAGLAVLDGKVDAAFVSGLHLSGLVRTGQARPDAFLVLWRSEPIPLDPFVYRGQLCKKIKDTIRAVFLDNSGKANAPLLEKLQALRFVPMSDADYRIIRDLP